VLIYRMYECIKDRVACAVAMLSALALSQAWPAPTRGCWLQAFYWPETDAY